MKNSPYRKISYGAAQLPAHQVEGGWNKGGKGPSICDVLTGGAHGVPREITKEVLPGKILSEP